MKYKEGEEVDTPEQKQAFWKAANDNQDVRRKGTGDGTVVLVDKGTTWSAIRERALTVTINRSTNLESQKQVDDAMVQLAQTGSSVGTFSGGAAFKCIGDTPEIAASSNPWPDAGQQALTSAASAPPAAAVVIPEDFFAPYGTSSGHNSQGKEAVQQEDSEVPGRRASWGFA